jgi:hypothetical protein
MGLEFQFQTAPKYRRMQTPKPTEGGIDHLKLPEYRLHQAIQHSARSAVCMVQAIPDARRHKFLKVVYMSLLKMMIALHQSFMP